MRAPARARLVATPLTLLAAVAFAACPEAERQDAPEVCVTMMQCFFPAGEPSRFDALPVDSDFFALREQVVQQPIRRAYNERDGTCWLESPAVAERCADRCAQVVAQWCADEEIRALTAANDAAGRAACSPDPCDEGEPPGGE